ncbi:MAG: LysR family transcriptional regulator [bacterium]
MLLWMISGAHRKVGKTHLAKRLCAVLPDSAYAKLGHGARAAGKSRNYFTQPEDLLRFIEQCTTALSHVVVETNLTLFPEAACLRIFVGDNGGPGEPRLDAFELFTRADIRVVAGGAADSWRAVLSAKLDDGPIVDAVLAELLAQKRWLERTAVAVHSKVWLVNREMEHVFGPGLADLLTDIEHLGSLKAAAMRNNVSYRHAWGAIRNAEKHFGIALVTASSGGPGGGRSSITVDAKRVLARFRLLSERVADYADREFASLYLAEERDSDG